MKDRIYETKEYLKSVKAIQIKLQYEFEKLEMLESLKYRVPGGTPTRERVQESRRTDYLERTVFKIIEGQKKINKRVDEYMAEIEKVERFIDNIKQEEYRQIMRDRYILNHKFEEIAVKNHYELSWVYRVHRNCIDFLSKIKR